MCYYDILAKLPCAEPWKSHRRAVALDAVAKAGHYRRCGTAQAGLPNSIGSFFGSCHDEAMDLAKKGLITLESYIHSVGMPSLPDAKMPMPRIYECMHVLLCDTCVYPLMP